ERSTERVVNFDIGRQERATGTISDFRDPPTLVDQEYAPRIGRIEPIPDEPISGIDAVARDTRRGIQTGEWGKLGALVVVDIARTHEDRHRDGDHGGVGRV